MILLRKLLKWLGILVLGFGLLLAVVSAIDGKMDNAAIILIVFGVPGGILWKIGRGGSQKAQDEDGEPESTSSDTPSPDESGAESEELPTWSYDEDSPESLIRSLFWGATIANGWFEDDEKTIRFEDGTTVVTKMESIDDPGILLENFDEMRSSRAKEIDGVSTQDNDAIMAALQGKENMHHRIYTIDFSSSSQVQGTGGDMTIVYRVIQVEGEEVGEDIEISSDIDRDSLTKWASREWRESEDEEGFLISGDQGGSQKAQDEDGEPEESNSFDTPSPDESGTESEELPTWSYDDDAPESLIRRLFRFTSIGNGWFDWDDEKTIRFQDGTTIITKIETIDDAGILLENFDEMRSSRAKEIDGVSTQDNDAIMAALQGRDDMHHRIYTMDFSSSSEVQGTGGDMTVIFRTVQVGGEEVGEDIEISSDIDRDSLTKWASREWRESEDEEGLLISGE